MTTAQGSGNQDTLITGDELARMPDHDLTELIDGRIVPLSPTNPEHGRLEFKVATLLNSIVRRTIWDSSWSVFISHDQHERRTKTRDFLDVAPEMVVEILSPERPDTDQKVIEYLTIGVPLVLVVDPGSRTISAHRSDGTVRQYGESDMVPCDDALAGIQPACGGCFRHVVFDM